MSFKNSNNGLQRPFLFFDIGSTLMDGPDFSPASRFTRELDLLPGEKEAVNNFLFTEDITDPGDLICRFREVLPRISDDVDDKIRKIWDAQVTEGFIIPGAMEALTSLSQKGCRMGIISNIWHPYYLCFERLFAPLMHKFESIILSYRVGSRKPHEEIFRQALKSLEGKTEGDPSSVAIVGDSYYHDIAPAIKLGIKTVWVLREYKRDAPFMKDVLTGKAAGPFMAVSEIGELGHMEQDLLN